jgi:hypothetical protein
MNLVSQIVDFLESEGFGNAAKFLRKYRTNKKPYEDMAITEILSDPDVSPAIKIMILANEVVPETPEPNMNAGYPQGIENNLQDIAWTQWKTQQDVRKAMNDIAKALNAHYFGAVPIKELNHES